MTEHDNKPPFSLAELSPGQTPGSYVEAQENVDRYLALIIRIYDRIIADPEAHAKLRAELKRQKDAIDTDLGR